MKINIPKNFNNPANIAKINSKNIKTIPSKYKVSTYSDNYKREYVKSVLKQFSMVSVDDSNTKTVIENELVTYNDDTEREFSIEIKVERTQSDDIISESRKIKTIKR